MGTEGDDISLAIVRVEVRQLSKDVEDLTAATKELVEAWKAAGKLVALVKWVAGLVTALSALWVAFHYGLNGKP